MKHCKHWFTDELINYITPSILPSTNSSTTVRGLDRPVQFSKLATNSRQSSCSLINSHGRDSSIKLNGRYV